MVTETATMSVREALQLPVLRGGLPEVLAGNDQLERKIRWVHVGEVPNLSSLLAGGELVLTTGTGIGSRPAQQQAYINGLAEREIAALVLAPGYAFQSPPRALVAAAARRDLPLVALHRDIRFVDVTEAIHTQLVSSRYALTRRADDLLRHLTRLLLEGEGIPAVIAGLSSALGAPVFLEDAEGQLLAHAARKNYDLDVLAVWEATRESKDSDAVRSASVRNAGRNAGRNADGMLLVADLQPSSAALAGAMLDRAADAIALAIMGDRQERLLLARERSSVLRGLASGGFYTPEAAHRALKVGGLRSAPQLRLPAAAIARGDPWQADGRRVRAVDDAARAEGIDAALGHGDSGALLWVAALSSADRREELADQLAVALRRAFDESHGELTIVVGRPVTLGTAGAEMRAVEEGAASAQVLGPQPWYDVSDLEVRRLLWRRRGGAELGDLVDRVLGRLLDHDRSSRNPLLPTLTALLASGGSKAETARALHLNRQSLYARVARLEDLLDIDLNDDEQWLVVHLAVRALDYVKA
jgi:PucR family transcriptional regulator, purine catabolism regulatory protein